MFPAGKAVDAREFDKRAVERGIPSLILMENAAFSLFLEVSRVIDEFKPEKIVVFAGKGGNGGDGFALLRILKDRGCNIPMYIVPFFTVTPLHNSTGAINRAPALTTHDSPFTVHDSLTNWKMLPKSVEITGMENISGKVLFIDAMVGTGLKDDLTGRMREGVEFINKYNDKFVVAVDIPTGLNSDTGIIMGVAVVADLTVTMGIYKTGLFASKGPSVSGRIVLGKISAIDDDNAQYSYFVEENVVPESFDIPIDSFKNKNGHLLIIGGDLDKLGATIISARSFMVSGGGLVTAAFSKDLHEKIAGVMPGMMLADIDEVPKKLHQFSSIIIGPGLSKWPFEKHDIFKNYKGILIIDAGMFDIMNEFNYILESLKDLKVVFTPHPGELKRFLKAHTDEPWIDSVERFQLKKDHILVAKSHSTFIRSVEKTVIIPHGAKALSFGGSGDALTGLIAYETNFSGFESGVKRAVLRHRMAGIELEKRYSATFHDIGKLIELIGITGKKDVC
ncbi:MAG TPA: NAD(P)H-hydrate epimerase [bacterium]|nr:NAD(P)H-hydrate epimerase [bacterium]HOB70460.1 NAD(P)H-hydrate epimerase [bacterium]HOG44028.1 NAD(P)H-hydrate epimerase [bacterium]HPY13786.1 NAD(P)H-hydrate epimerase [bacterium]HQB08358.1 NAD(P)H-hydrate epimerase [bacterium]